MEGFVVVGKDKQQPKRKARRVVELERQLLASDHAAWLEDAFPLGLPEGFM